MPKPIVDAGLVRAYDPFEDVTRVWDKGNKFLGTEKGNTEKLGGSAIGPLSYSSGESNMGIPQINRGKSGDVDWGKTAGNVLQDLIPTAAQMLVPESQALSPLKNVLMKMAVSTASGTALDQLRSLLQGDNTPTLDSVTKSAGNAGVGIGLPELLNIKPTLSGYKRTSTSSATPTISETTGSSAGNSQSAGTTNTEMRGSSANTTSGSSTSNTKGINDITSTGMTKNLSHSDAVKLGFTPQDTVTETIRIDPDTKRFVKAYTVVKNVPREGQYQTNTTVDSNGSSQYDRLSNAIFGSDTSSTSNSNSQGTNVSNSTSSTAGNTTSNAQRSGVTTTTPGVRSTVSEVPPPWYIKLAQMVGSDKYNGRLGPGQGNITSLQSALSGLGLNFLLDNKQDQLPAKK